MGRQARFRETHWPWIGAALTLLFACLAWTLLSKQFVYGQGHPERPILAFLVCYAAAWLAFATACYLLTKQKSTSLSFVITIALAARLLLIPSNLIQENDVYRYVLDGNLVRRGENPYRHSPLVVSDLGSADLKVELRMPEAQKVLSQIGYPEIPTIYPPAAQLAFASGAWLGGWSWLGQRWIALGLDLLVLFSLIQLLKSLAIPLSWITLYAWNPLVLKEVINSVHIDILVALFALLLISQLLRYGRTAKKSAIGFAGAALGMAVLTKLYPLLLAPACLFYIWRSRRSSKDLLYFGVITILTVAAGYLPFGFAGWERLTAGLEAYLRVWRMNEGAFALSAYLSSNPRMVVAVVLAGISVLIPWLRRNGSVDSVMGDFQWILLFWFLLLPAAFPWYAVPMAALACTRPGALASRVTVILSGVVALYYLSFFYDYHEYAHGWWMATRLVEHCILWGSLAYLALRHFQLVNLFKRRKANAYGGQSFSFFDYRSLLHVFSSSTEGRKRSG